ncbi:MAG: putative dithiol-disulfide oxidoreductase (DUF899 family) [Planctomycetota bacterium]|jgi:predicted dithiol-disulfide oxidoreductase (DUF899 family)
MKNQKIVSSDEWIAMRKAFLIKEKEFTKARDALSQARRELPWRKVEKDYLVEGAAGKETLADLFGGSGQLIIYHFMFGPEWEEGCPSCSYWADNFNRIDLHLKQRDISFLAVSRAPLAKLDAYKKRLGWRFKWVSSHGSDFNFDYDVSFTPEQIEKGEVYYNYREMAFPSSEGPGISVFYKDDAGVIFHTYSC